MIDDIKSSALAFVYAWAIILGPILTIVSVGHFVQSLSPPIQESI